MRNRSIVTKIVVSVCGIVSFLLLSGGFVLMSFEMNMIESFMKEYQEKIDRSIADRSRESSESLRKNAEFNAKILSQVSAIHLFNYSSEDLHPTLVSYMEYPEITAIKFVDEYGEPFAATWKGPGLQFGDDFPEDISLNEKLSVSAPCHFEERQVGELTLYYTDAIFRENLRLARENILGSAKVFKDTSYSTLNRALISQSAGIVIILLILSLCLALFLRRLILRPLHTVSSAADHLARFDLTVSMDIKGKDEIGILLGAVNKMASAFRKIVKDVKYRGRELARTSEQMMKNIHTIASAAEEMSLNVRDVSEIGVQLSRNINAVAGSIEQMSASVSSVEKSARQDLTVTGAAVTMARNAEEKMNALDDTAARIGAVTDVIKRIAEKTALLALNADIEAASAGEAGRGFAVVANEIREFAEQNSQAADDITARISLMQENTRDAVTTITEITDLIKTINHSSEINTSALSEQMKGVNEIAVNAFEAGARSNEIAASMAQLAQGANEISMSVGMAASGKRSDEEEEKTHYMDASAENVAKLARELLELVDKFRVDV